MEMNVSGPNSQPLKLPIPRLHNLHTPNTKFPEMLIPNNNWQPTASTQFPTTLPSTQQVISCRKYKTFFSSFKNEPFNL